MQYVCCIDKAKATYITKFIWIYIYWRFILYFILFYINTSMYDDFLIFFFYILLHTYYFFILLYIYTFWTNFFYVSCIIYYTLLFNSTALLCVYVYVIYEQIQRNSSFYYLYSIAWFHQQFHLCMNIIFRRSFVVIFKYFFRISCYFLIIFIFFRWL